MITNLLRNFMILELVILIIFMSSAIFFAWSLKMLGRLWANKIIIKNKRGDLATTLFTLMVVVLFIATVAIIYRGSSKLEVKTLDSQFIGKVYVHEKEIQFEINSAGERAFIEAYKDVLTQDSL